MLHATNRVEASPSSVETTVATTGDAVVDAAAGAPKPSLPATIWYMGVKTRVLDGFLARALGEEVPAGGAVLDLFAGTGVVASYCSQRFQTFAADAQLYSQVLTRAFIEHTPSSRDELLRRVDWEADLKDAFEERRSELEKPYREALAAEARHLEAAGAFAGDRSRRVRGSDPAARARAVEAYRGYLQLAGARYGDGEAASPAANGETAADPFATVRPLFSEDAIARCRRDPTTRPARLVTAYYANVYFGLRQAIDLDALRGAIEDCARRASGADLAQRKRIHYLAALLRTASITTSGTSHFAQPRHLRKDSEILAMVKRRRTDVVTVFRRCVAELGEAIAAVPFRDGNRWLGGDYRDVLGDNAPRVDLVYVDPPYTADNYSRFYHVLEVLARYDYPQLQRDRHGAVVRGRYPVIESRFQSGFCRPGQVEREFEHVIESVARTGAKLALSYASPGGLLLKTYAKESPETDPVERLEDLCRRHYREVEVRRLPLLHSGQGDSQIEVEELLLLGRQPRGRS